MTIIDKKCLEKLVRGIPKDNMSKDALIRLRRLLYTLRDAYNIKGFECLVEEGLMVSHKIEHLKGAAREVSSEYLLQVPATLKNLASEWCALDSNTRPPKPKTTCHTHTLAVACRPVSCYSRAGNLATQLLEAKGDVDAAIMAFETELTGILETLDCTDTTGIQNHIVSGLKEIFISGDKALAAKIEIIEEYEAVRESGAETAKVSLDASVGTFSFPCPCPCPCMHMHLDMHILPNRPNRALS